VGAPADPPPGDPEGSPAALPTRVVAAAYLLALLCALIPLAAIGSAFAGIVLLRRGRARDGAGVLALTAVCAAIGVMLLYGQ
jgi:hypothetical protein